MAEQKNHIFIEWYSVYTLKYIFQRIMYDFG